MKFGCNQSQLWLSGVEMYICIYPADDDMCHTDVAFGNDTTAGSLAADLAIKKHGNIAMLQKLLLHP